VKGHEIDVDTDHGVVTLKGKVESENARQQAADRAESMA
jgi:osmotically-inducible protein OsmY